MAMVGFLKRRLMTDINQRAYCVDVYGCGDGDRARD